MTTKILKAAVIGGALGLAFGACDRSENEQVRRDLRNEDQIPEGGNPQGAFGGGGYQGSGEVESDSGGGPIAEPREQTPRREDDPDAPSRQPPQQQSP